MKIAFVSLLKNDSRSPPIGLLRIATYLKNNSSDLEVRLFDSAFENLFEKINKFKPDIIGLTTYTSYYQTDIDFAKKIKKIYPNILIIIGGPHITTLPNSFNSAFDYGIIGEGEKAMLELINSLKNKKKINNIAGLLYFSSKDKLIINRKTELCKNLDEVHKIDYGFLNKNYFKTRFIPEIYKTGTAMGIMTSIGCPFKCRFCSIKICWDNTRFRNIGNVVNEIKDLYYNYNIRHIDFYDDLFSINKKRLREFYSRLKEERLLNKITFSCMARANTIDDEMCKILKSLNILTLTFGFESGSDKILRYIKNDQFISDEINRKAVQLCVSNGLNVFGCLMMGMPNENIEDLQKTIDFIDFSIKNKVARLWVQILIPFPGTEMWEIAKNKGKFSDNQIDWNNIHIHNRNNLILLDNDLSHSEFLKMYNLAKKKCQIFVYRMIFKTAVSDPFLSFYFLKETPYYLRRLFDFFKQ